MCSTNCSIGELDSGSIELLIGTSFYGTGEVSGQLEWIGKRDLQPGPPPEEEILLFLKCYDPLKEELQ
ncbi:hypothetical protein RHSIM_Rhsim05G0137400 [Rhododendron simsii]|uniref:Uncharacterized protein n=1 Tax=Rhododendron simsii TaxID=118357 RepID=A0A834GVW6_RHOSS|nr:hypothetical protein RHSIM_Rhsim05G0137400 [Rhododendron simsii]